ncbi:hypothetical protein COOONC_01068 [Cooperia oncophora]
MHEAYRRYGHSKSFHCNSCDSRLICPRAACRNTECPLLGVTPKRCKASKRTTIHFLQIEPQLSLILGRILSRLIQTHRQIHAGDDSGKRSETYSFPWYKRFIETHTDFDECKINIILTINFDGVKLKKLSRSQTWPIYLRIEGLPFKEKNKVENIGITFSKKAPQKPCCEKCFLDFVANWRRCWTAEIPIVVDDRTWFCTPVLSKGVIDFSALKHYTTYPAGSHRTVAICALSRVKEGGHRVIWFPRFPYAGDRRTFASITRDAIFITATRNFTYAAKFVLGMDDLSGITGSEKDALSFVAFPLAAALNICAEPVGAVAVLAYWILVRVLEKSAELIAVHGVQELASAMKDLWYAIEPTLCTMKVHVSVVVFLIM